MNQFVLGHSFKKFEMLHEQHVVPLHVIKGLWFSNLQREVRVNRKWLVSTLSGLCQLRVGFMYRKIPDDFMYPHS